MTPNCTVKEGDTLAAISKSIYGDPGHTLQIASANNMRVADILPIGKSLIIPSSSYTPTKTDKLNGKPYVFLSKVPAGGDIFDKDLFLYSPADETFIRVDNEDVPEFYQGVDECNQFVNQIMDARQGAREDTVSGHLASKIESIKKDFLGYLKEADSGPKSGEGGESLPIKAKAGIETKLKEFVTLNVVGAERKDGKSAPLYKGFVYIRSDKIKSHWRKSQDKTLHKLFDEKEKDEKAGLKKKIVDNFKEKILEKLKQEKTLWGGDENDILAPSYKLSTDPSIGGERWDFSAGAQFLRFSAGASLKSSVNLKNLEASIDFAGSATFALAEGKSSGHVYLTPKEGVDVLRLLEDAGKKVAGLLDGTGRQPASTALTRQQRHVFLRLTIGYEASAFAGATASFEFPKLELKPSGQKADAVKVSSADLPKDVKLVASKIKAPPPAQRMAMVSLDGEAFAGAQAEIKLTSKAEWKPGVSAKEWKSLLSAEAGVAGSVGIGAQAKLYFGFREGHIRFCCSFQSTFVVGGKVLWDNDLGLEEGLEFVAEIVRCVDYHYVAEIAEDLYETLGAYKYLMLLTPPTSAALAGLYVMKDIDTDVDKAHKFISESRNLFQQITKFVDKHVEDDLFHISEDNAQAIEALADKISTCPPEAVGRYLLVLMKTPDESDYTLIPQVLGGLGGDHALRWVIRCVGLLTILDAEHKKNPGRPFVTFENTPPLQVKGDTVIASNAELRAIVETLKPDGTGKQKDAMLDAGVKRLLDFGKTNDGYTNELKKLFLSKGVNYEV